MKYYNKLWLGAIALSLFASCADESELDFFANKPENFAQLEYLNDYDVLKSYVDRTANPGFKLGAGVSVDDFTKKGVNYSLIVSNFDEMTAGWEMKHGAVVQENGSLNLSNVEKFIATAKDAGLTIYGHTLCWHSNQNAKYLNKTIAPVVIQGNTGPKWEVITKADFETSDASNYQSNTGAVLSFTAVGEGKGGTGRALKISNSEVRANEWDSQFFITFTPAMKVGETYELSFDVRADKACSFATQAHVVPYQYKYWDFFGSVDATTEWAPFKKQITITADVATTGAIAFNLGKTATNYYLDNVKLTKLNPNAGGPSWDLVSGANFETSDASNYQSNSGAALSFTNAGEGANATGKALKITNSTVRANEWDSQFFVTFSPAMKVGEKYKLSMDVKADVACSFATQAHVVPYQYKYWDFFGSINATTSWTPFEKEITVTTDIETTGAIAFNLGKTATTYYFDNIKLTKYNEDGGSKTIVKTPEEKKQIISGELDKWIKGIMGVSKDYVKAWDVVNEPMDDGKPHELKTGVNKTLAEDEFYWQDYLGKDYAVDAFKLAAQYGNSDDKLFINDYNLEYNLEKCKGLIEFVEYIEGQGARVDGIGTQMHITASSDKEKIVSMFEMLAKTGKLIKISELDMGVGKKTAEATDEDYKAQAEMYNFVVKKYFEIIPAAQRYGITIWSPLDSPAGSSWRAGEPIGLWNEGYYRKRAYSGVADALAGK
jgi:GH35 family endo-1,4-beta-xylanase